MLYLTDLNDSYLAVLPSLFSSVCSRSQARGRHEDRGGGARRGIEMQWLDGFSGLADHPLASRASGHERERERAGANQGLQDLNDDSILEVQREVIGRLPAIDMFSGLIDIVGKNMPFYVTAHKYYMCF